jgi:hypothetical protein
MSVRRYTSQLKFGSAALASLERGVTGLAGTVVVTAKQPGTSQLLLTPWAAQAGMLVALGVLPAAASLQHVAVCNPLNILRTV